MFCNIGYRIWDHVSKLLFWMLFVLVDVWSAIYHLLFQELMVFSLVFFWVSEKKPFSIMLLALWLFKNVLPIDIESIAEIHYSKN